MSDGVIYTGFYPSSETKHAEWKTAGDIDEGKRSEIELFNATKGQKSSTSDFSTQ